MTRERFLNKNATLILDEYTWHKPRVNTEYTEPLFECPKCGSDVRRARKHGRIQKGGLWLYLYECEKCDYKEYLGTCES